MSDVRVRFAPSPTGFLHIGGLRTALYDYLFAKRNKGKLILRIEDTDQNRLVDGAIENLLEAFNKLDIKFDEGPTIGGSFGSYIQSQRLNIYRKYANELIEKGFAYYCFCTSDILDRMKVELQEKKLFPKYDRRCLCLSASEIHTRIENEEQYVIRLKMPDDRKFIIDDIVRGIVEIDTKQLDDQVIIKSDGYPTYHLAAVVDDHLMQISHVIRGEEWLSSTPKHIYLYECFGWKPPIWVHLPLILNPDRSKLSKRMNDVAVESYLQKGYLKETLVNFVALLGWHAADDRELYTLDELCYNFSLDRVSKAGAVFDVTKLDWMNSHYIRSLPVEYIADLCRNYFVSSGIDISNEEKYIKVVNISRNYINVLPEIIDYSKVYYYQNDLSTIDCSLICNQDSKSIFKWFINNLDNKVALSKIELEKIVNNAYMALKIKGKQFYHPLRLALIYKDSGPDIATIIDLLGVEESIIRIKNALLL